MFDLDKKTDGLPEPTKEELKRYQQKELNKRQKSVAKMVGENLASYACVAIIIVLISFIWTDIGLNIHLTSFFTDAAVTVVLYVLADFCMTKAGTNGGKLSDDYINLHGDYLKLRKQVVESGITLMEGFCEWQAEREYESRMRKLCKRYKIDYEAFENFYSKARIEDLQGKLTKSEIAKVVALRQIDRIELTPDILLTDGKVKDERGGIPISGEEYAERHSTGAGHIFVTVAFAIVAAVPVFTLTQDMSIGRVIYTVFKVSMMLYRMYCGYTRGAKAYNTIEPVHLQAKIKYLYLYIEYCNNLKTKDSEV